MNKITRALISVSDKTGVVDFARQLQERNIDILSTGGTAKLLAAEGITVTEVADYTGFPEMMDGRVKTLNPLVHGGILGRRGTDDAVMAEHGIQPIDMVVVNLYPFEATIANPDCELATAIENIDIGGPTMVRAAAKNHKDVTIIVYPADYADIIRAMDENSGAVSDALRFSLAVKAFEHTSSYDGAIANYLGTIQDDGSKVEYPRTFNLQFDKAQEMRYGENPHQSAAFYTEGHAETGSVSSATQLQGKALSFNKDRKSVV